MPFLVLRHLCLLGFFDSFWRLFSLVHVFLSPLKFPMGLYIFFITNVKYQININWLVGWLGLYCSFNSKSSLYIYIRYIIQFGWVLGILTIVGYLIPSLLYTYILNNYDLWIELLWLENPVNTWAWHTETLDSCFNLIRSHQQCIPWSPPLEIKPATTEHRAETLQLCPQSTLHTSDAKLTSHDNCTAN